MKRTGIKRRIRRDPLDALFTQYIRLKTDNVCEWCGKKGYVEVSHFHGRRKWFTRLDEENVAGLCRGCHTYLGENPDVHSDFFRKRLGYLGYEALNARAQIVRKRSKRDEGEIKASLLEKIKLLEEGK